ncbi:MAG: glycosyltransferase family 2 protein [Isosphaeraceae bacterium]
MVRVSVVVPTFRRPDLLDRCLTALLAQNLDPAQYEILIADDAASQATEKQVKRRAEQTGVTVRYLAVTGAHGPAAARNVGWRLARGLIIAFTDDDCIPDSNWLKEGLAAFDNEMTAVTGRVVVPRPKTPTDYEHDAAGLETGEFVTANCLVRREALERVGGFDERFSSAWREDSDLHFALLRQGGRIVKAPSALVVHPVRPAPWGVSLKQQKKSLFNALLYRKHPEEYRRRIRSSPPWDYYATVLSLCLAGSAIVSGDRRILWPSLISWIVLTGRFCYRRLERASRAPLHIFEMVVTSALIPPLSVFWRLYGAWKFRVLFF